MRCPSLRLSTSIRQRRRKQSYKHGPPHTKYTQEVASCQTVLKEVTAMRSLTCLLATILLACIGPQVLVVAQEEGPCPNNDTELPSQLGGRHLPAYDTVRVLVVFIDFPDDDESPADTAWPVGSGPTFKNTIVYQNPASATSGSMTHFLRGNELWLLPFRG
jgi:hypothetical protein